MDLDTIRQIRDYTNESKFCSRISLAGAGEFFLHTDWKEIIGILNADKCDVEILTNGLVLDHAHIDYIWTQTSVKMLQFSMDAADGDCYYNIRGSTQFSRIKNILRYTCSHPERKVVRLSFVVMNENLKHIVSFVHFASEMGADGVLYQHMHNRPLITTKRANGFVFDESQHPNKSERKRLILKAVSVAKRLDIFVQLNQMPEIEISDEDYYRCKSKYYRHEDSDFGIQSPCCLPWTMINRTLEGSWRVCCMSEMNSHLGGKNATLQEAWNSKEIQEIRRKLLQGKCPQECMPEFCDVASELKKAH